MDQKIEDFIRQNANKNLAEVALLLGKNQSFPKEYIINQINGRRKSLKKFPFLKDYSDFRFPSVRAVEQSSSEQTAKYKADLLSGNTLVDLSGGMGVDSYFFSKQFERVHYVEFDKELYANTTFNFDSTLKSGNIIAHNTEASAFLKAFNEDVDCFFIDPDRRVNKSKAFLIEDCEPNVVELLPIIFQKANQCLIKLSPMLDISQAINQIEFCKEVHVISHQNECKELLFLVEKDFKGEAKIIAIDLDKEDSTYSFNYLEEKLISVSFSEPQRFLYDPNVSILKAGAFKSIANSFGLNKLAPSTHLYTSNEYNGKFPGRVFEIKSVNAPQKGLIKKANVVAKNFLMRVDEVKKKYKIQDGGDDYVYACRLENNRKVFIHCEKV